MELPGLFSCVWLLFVQYCLRFIHVVAALVCRGLCSVSLPYCAFIHPAVVQAPVGGAMPFKN